MAAVKKMPEPRSLQSVHHFLGMPQLSATSEPLPALLKEMQSSSCLRQKKSAFQSLKDMISQEQFLNFYNIRKPVVIQCDASTEGVGALYTFKSRTSGHLSLPVTNQKRRQLRSTGVRVLGSSFCLPKI